MVERSYCPMIWLDEAVGVRVADPSDCIVTDGSNWAMVDDDWRESQGQIGTIIDLMPGEVVKFGYGESRGCIEIIRHPDGEGFTHIATTPIPTDATSWWLPDELETSGDTLTELVREHVQPGARVTVAAAFWAFDIPFFFQVEDGKGRFVQSAGAN